MDSLFLINVDVEFLRTADLISDLMESILLEHLSIDRLKRDLGRKLLFHAGVRRGKFLPLSILPIQNSHRTLPSTGGALQQFIVNALFILCHEASHIEGMQGENQRESILKNSLKSPDAHATLELVIRKWGIDPLRVVRQLNKNHRIEHYIEILDTIDEKSDGWFSEIEGDFKGAGFVLGIYNKFEFSYSNTISAMIGAQFTLFILDVTELFWRDSGILSRKSCDLIVYSIQRLIVFLAAMISIVELKFHRFYHKKSINTMMNVVKAMFQMSIDVLVSNQEMIVKNISKVERNHKTQRDIVDQWGYKFDRVSFLLGNTPYGFI